MLWWRSLSSFTCRKRVGCKILESAKKVKVIPPSDESIDYYFEIDSLSEVSDTVLMAFASQIFVTRSNVAIVKGIQEDKPELMGIFNSLGDEIHG